MSGADVMGSESLPRVLERVRRNLEDSAPPEGDLAMERVVVHPDEMSTVRIEGDVEDLIGFEAELGRRTLDGPYTARRLPDGSVGVFREDEW